MENSFSKRFKSSMKIGKNHSIFENLVPIDKKIKPSQVHDDNLIKNWKTQTLWVLSRRKVRKIKLHICAARDNIGIKYAKSI